MSNRLLFLSEVLSLNNFVLLRKDNHFVWCKSSQDLPQDSYPCNHHRQHMSVLSRCNFVIKEAFLSVKCNCLYWHSSLSGFLQCNQTSFRTARLVRNST